MVIFLIILSSLPVRSQLGQKYTEHKRKSKYGLSNISNAIPLPAALLIPKEVGIAIIEKISLKYGLWQDHFWENNTFSWSCIYCSFIFPLWEVVSDPKTMIMYSWMYIMLFIFAPYSFCLHLSLYSHTDTYLLFPYLPFFYYKNQWNYYLIFSL